MPTKDNIGTPMTATVAFALLAPVHQEPTTDRVLSWVAATPQPESASLQRHR